MRFGYDINIAILAGEMHVWPEVGFRRSMNKCHIGLGAQWIPRLRLQQTALTSASPTRR